MDPYSPALCWGAERAGAQYDFKCYCPGRSYWGEGSKTQPTFRGPGLGPSPDQRYRHFQTSLAL